MGMECTVAHHTTMKKHLLLFILFVTPVNTVIFATRGGCGTFLAVPLLLGVHMISFCFGSFFAENHLYLVAALGALVAASLISVIVALIAVALRKTGHLTSRRSLTILFVVTALVYMSLGLLNYPQGPCL